MRTVAAMMSPTCGGECKHMIGDAGGIAIIVQAGGVAAADADLLECS